MGRSKNCCRFHASRESNCPKKHSFFPQNVPQQKIGPGGNHPHQTHSKNTLSYLLFPLFADVNQNIVIRQLLMQTGGAQNKCLSSKVTKRNTYGILY